MRGRTRKLWGETRSFASELSLRPLGFAPHVNMLQICPREKIWQVIMTSGMEKVTEFEKKERREIMRMTKMTDGETLKW